MGGGKKAGGHTIVVPKYKRTDRNKLKERLAAVDQVDAIKPLLSGELKEVIGEAQYAHTITHLYDINWHGKFLEARAIVEASPDPLTDKKCWSQLGFLMDAEDRKRLLEKKYIDQYEQESHCVQEYLTMCDYVPNEMNLQELCTHALYALCMPPKSQKTAQVLWAKMLELFLAMDIHLIVQKYQPVIAGKDPKEHGFTAEPVIDIVTMAKRMEQKQPFKKSI